MKTNSFKILDHYTVYGREGDWTLKRDTVAKSRKTGEDHAVEETVGYWGNLQHVMEKIIRLEGESASSLQDYVTRVENAAQLVAKAIQK